jgi:cytochrome c553
MLVKRSTRFILISMALCHQGVPWGINTACTFCHDKGMKESPHYVKYHNNKKKITNKQQKNHQLKCRTKGITSISLSER